MVNVIVSEKKLLSCPRCGQTVVKRISKRLKKEVLVDVYQDIGKLVLVMKNRSIVEHRC